MSRRLTATLLAAVLTALTLVAGPGPAAAAPTQARSVEYVRGGDFFYTSPPSGGRCVVAFTVVGGFLTSGRCGRAGQVVYTGAGTPMGVFITASFPVNDYAWVHLYPGFVPLPEVRTGSSTVVVKGANPAPIGGSVCRFGATTGWRCGTVTAKNATINYAEGAVYGLTRTTACVEPGDAGGPFLAGNQAQGITSGGSGNCTSGGTSYFQPIAEPLAAYGLTLLTG